MTGSLVSFFFDDVFDEEDVFVDDDDDDDFFFRSEVEFDFLAPEASVRDFRSELDCFRSLS